MAGTPYNGLPANIASPASVNITSSTNAIPIVVQTAAPHGCKTGDFVDVTNHNTNTNANGIWPVVVVDATHLQLTGSTGNGIGGATGTLQPLTFTGNVGLNPVNGDPYDASTYIPGMSALGDRTAWAALNTGKYKVSNRFYFTQGLATPFNSLSSIVGGLASLTWTDWPGGIGPFASVAGTPINVVPNDIVVFDVQGTFNFVTNNGDAATIQYALGLWHGYTAPPGPPSFVLAATEAFANMVPSAGSWTQQYGFKISSQLPIGGVSGAVCDFKLMVEANQVTARGLNLVGQLLASATVYRATSWPQ